MSLLGDAQVEAAAAWAEYSRTHPNIGGLPQRAAFMSGYLAAWPLIETQLREHALEVLSAHGARDNYDDEGEYIGYICKCRAKESGPYDTDHAAHVADVLAARVVRGTTNQEDSE